MNGLSLFIYHDNHTFLTHPHISTVAHHLGCFAFFWSYEFFISQNPSVCAQGSPGLPGRNGVNGHNGLPGRDGRGGAKGEKGVAGPLGPSGNKGEVGAKGVAGPPGPRGINGEAGPVGKVAAEQRNWKQCAWQKGNSRDAGLIKVSGKQLQIFLSHFQWTKLQ